MKKETTLKFSWEVEDDDYTDYLYDELSDTAIHWVAHMMCDCITKGDLHHATEGEDGKVTEYEGSWEISHSF